MTDRPQNKEQAPGNVQAFDVRTRQAALDVQGHSRAGEVGSDTWESDSWAYSGAGEPVVADQRRRGTGIRVSSADERRPTTCTAAIGSATTCSPTRWSASDVLTGERVWHYQIVHHDLWDYDLPAAPILADITVDGRRESRRCVQLTKQAFAFVFDRTTGQPVWPIEERPVPTSDTPGERTSPDAAVSRPSRRRSIGRASRSTI